MLAKEIAEMAYQLALHMRKANATFFVEGVGRLMLDQSDDGSDRYQRLADGIEFAEFEECIKVDRKED